MLSENLHEFLLASVGASATFIGLLFVALTLVISKVPVGSYLAARERILAASSYTALITIFFISMIGLIPGANVAWVMVIMGWLGMGSSVRLAQDLRRKSSHRDKAAAISSLTLVYFALSIFGLYTVFLHEGEINNSIFFVIVFVLYTTALGRAWALIGVEDPSEVRTRTSARPSASNKAE
jgi:hypothetical protein